MCGRYAIFSDPGRLAERFGAAVDGGYETYNAAPSQSLPVLCDDDRFRRLQWGFVPAWADDASPGPINARAETLAEKPMFADARRCIVPCDGFYEWRDGQPYYFSRPDDRPFAMAGVWATYEPTTRQVGLGEFGDDGPRRDADPVHSFAIVTRAATGVVADYHHRESVVLDAPDEWLAGGDVSGENPDFDVRPVSTAVNDPANDRPALIERA